MSDNLSSTILGCTIAVCISSFLAFLVYANTIGEKTPAEFGLVQEVKDLGCTPTYKIIWVKP